MAGVVILVLILILIVAVALISAVTVIMVRVVIMTLGSRRPVGSGAILPGPQLMLLGPGRPDAAGYSMHKTVNLRYPYVDTF